LLCLTCFPVTIKALVIYEHVNSNTLVGYWRNSYDRHTLAIGKNVYKHPTPLGNFGIKLGIASGYHVPVFGSIYYDAKHFSINWLPGEVIGIGLRIDL